jgi:biotin carboxylase
MRTSQQFTGRGGQQVTKPLLLVVGSSDQAWREYMLRSMASRCRLHLFSAKPPTWETPYIAAHDLVDTLDSGAMIEFARRNPEQFAGVITYWETRAEAVAEIALALGLTTSPLQAVRACRDKYLSRRALKSADVPQAESLAVADLGEALSAASRIGFPVVVKPRALSSSNGVTLAATPEELDVAFRQAGSARFTGVPAYTPPVLIEEYLDGPEISVDSVCHKGRVTPLFLARKRLGFAPGFEEVGHIVQSDDPLLTDRRVSSILQQAHAALGLTDAMTHTELRLTASGPHVVEVNIRTGGDLIPCLGQLATGLDLGLVAADLALGRSVDLRMTRRTVAGVRFLYPDRDLTVESVIVDRDRLPVEVKDVKVLATPGQRLWLPPKEHVSCRYASVIVEAGSVQECSAALEEASRAFMICGTPIEETRVCGSTGFRETRSASRSTVPR